MVDFEVHGLEEFREKLRLIEKKAPDRILRELDKQGNKLRKEVRKNTPSKTGGLRGGWQLAKVEKVAGGYQKGMYNKKPHFHLVEDGHRKVTPGGREIGWTPGVFMLEKTMKQQDPVITKELRAWLDELFKELK